MSELSTSSGNGFRGMLKLGVILALYAAAACVGLAFVYAGTRERIDINQKAIMEEALNDLFPGADFEPVYNVKIMDSESKVTIDLNKEDPQDTGVIAARKNNAVLGLALRTNMGAFGGPIKLLVGVDTDGKISGIKILEHSETPGLGANAVKPAFYSQFAGKPVTDGFEAKKDVDAITAATITSRAVAESVKAAGEAAMSWFSSQAGGSR